MRTLASARVPSDPRLPPNLWTLEASTAELLAGGSTEAASSTGESPCMSAKETTLTRPSSRRPGVRSVPRLFWSLVSRNSREDCGVAGSLFRIPYQTTRAHAHSRRPGLPLACAFSTATCVDGWSPSSSSSSSSFFLSDSSSRLLLSPNPNLLLAALQSNTAPDQRIPADSDRAGAPPDVTVR